MHSMEGIIQGYLLATVVYDIDILPLIKRL